MEWWQFLLVFFSGLGVLLIIGLPVAFAFLLVNLAGVYFLWGGTSGLNQIVMSIESSISTFVLVPIPMFILMGSIMFHTGIARKMIDVLDHWIGFISGRLAVLAIATGAVLGALTGVAMGSVAILGSSLLPEMKKRAYAKSMSIGPILASGSLAILIPPSTLAIVLASLAKISVAKMLVAIVVPGLLLAVMYGTYIVLRSTLNPALAPAYEVPQVPMTRRLKETFIHLLPPVSIIVFVILAIFYGVATPTEAAAVGTFVTFVLAGLYGRLNWEVIRTAISSATQLSVMVLIILTGSAAFSQLLSFAGVTSSIATFATQLPVDPIILLILMQLVIMFLGMFLEQTSIVLVSIPIFLPIIDAMGWDPVWFGTIMMLNLEMATITPPFGLSLFVMKGVVPPDVTIGEIYKAAIPFILINIALMGLMIAFPEIVLGLPNMMN